MLRLAFVTGTEPGKWLRRFEAGTSHGLEARGSDDPLAELAEGACDLALVRLPDARVTEHHHVVVLYEEAPGVAVPKDSVYAEVGESIAVGDLADDIVNLDFTPGTAIDDLRAALQVVAANVGVVFAPRPLLKVLSKKQVVALELIDAPASARPFRIALVWPKELDSEAVQDFVGVAKGRTMNSSRSSSPRPPVAARRGEKKVRKRGRGGGAGRGGRGRR